MLPVRTPLADAPETRPEAEIKYSRAQGASGAALPRRAAVLGRRRHRLRLVVLTGGLLGAALLLVAEFAPLLQVHSSASDRVVKTVATGVHHSYALLPVALLAAGLACVIWRTRSRLALLASALLGLLALVWLYEFLYESRFRNVLQTGLVRVGVAVFMVLYLCVCASGGGTFIYFQF